MADFPVDITIDEQTGQLLSVREPGLNMDILRFEPGPEFELNGSPLALEHMRTEARGAEHQTLMRVRRSPAYGAGNCLELRRYLTLGGMGLHTGRSNSLHIRYQLRRVPWLEWDKGDQLDYVWQPPLEAPLYVETLGALCAGARWFDGKARMRAIAIGGSGPREHVSLEDGPVAEVVPWLKTDFRRAFPGQQSIPGALYYEPDTEKFVWLIVRRPHVGGQLEFDGGRHAHQFAYFQALNVHDELMAPEISVFWGQGLAEADRILAEQFDLYEEPPEWWFKTCWFWLHPMWQRDATFDQTRRAVEILMDECGVKGFGLGIHDIPWSARDIDHRSPRPSPVMGGDDGLRRLCDLINSKGGHSYAWMSRTGLYPAGDYRDKWAIRGIDGRSCIIEPGCESGVKIAMVNSMDPDFREYLFRWLRKYVVDIGITGAFWDSGAQPMPPDFTQRDSLNCPGESMVNLVDFYERVYDFGKSLSKDFFMWVEGLTTEIRSNAFAVDAPKHGEGSGHDLMHRIADAGPRRLVWRSAWPHDLASGFPFINPTNDICKDPGPEFYKKISADPMNQWTCRIAAERGLRHATGIADGVSVLDEFVVTCPGISGKVTVPEEVCRSDSLKNVHSGKTVTGGRSEDGAVQFDLPGPGAWEMK